jgi:RiboL-PSP-HEPN
MFEAKKKQMAENPTMSERPLYDEYVNEVVTRYIIIRNVGAIEYYFRQMANMIVAKKGANYSKFFTNYKDFEPMLKKVNQSRGKRGRGKKLTKGQFFASQFNFVNAEEINWVFSRLLGLWFFDTVKRFNKYPLKNPYPHSKGFVRNWHNFEEMFELRNRIVHSMELVQLTRNQVRSLCSNTLNFIEQASILLNPPTRLGESGERDYFYQVIKGEKKRYRDEQKRTSEQSKKKPKRAVSPDVDGFMILPLL